MTADPATTGQPLLAYADAYAAASADAAQLSIFDAIEGELAT